MNKNLLEQYDAMQKEYADNKQRIRKLEDDLEKYDENYTVADSATGGLGGKQHFTVRGFPYPEYKRKRILLMERKLRMETLDIKLGEKLDEVERYIDTVADSRKRLILKYRYIDRLEWKEIAKKLGPGNSEDGVRKEIDRYLKKISEE